MDTGEKSGAADADSGQVEDLSTITRLLKGHRPLIYLHTYEESRALALVMRAVREFLGNQIPICRWSPTRGLTGAVESRDHTNPDLLMEFIGAQRSPMVFFLSDFHLIFHENFLIARKLRELYSDMLDSCVFIFFCSGVKEIPAEIESEIAYVEIAPPGLDELRDLVTHELQSRKDLQLDGEEISVVTRTLQGLSLNEARHALIASIISSQDRKDIIAFLQKEKKLQVRKQGIVEYIPEVTPIDHVGGLKNLKEWLTKRKMLMHLDSSYDREIIPKGILLMGMSGCGKSLSIKAIASLWELPLYRLDMIRIYSGMHGKPEEAFIRACETMEKVSPAVLWMDEIEMGIQVSETQEGTSSRIFGFFLTWMQEKKEGLFLAATANRIEFLPAEILRRGRFDQIFFIDLPSPEERADIFRIHLTKRGFVPDQFDLNLLVDLTDGCNGAEIEQCVASALIEARMAGRAPTQKDLISAKRLIVPLSKTMGEQIRRIKQWAFNRATPAS